MTLPPRMKFGIFLGPFHRVGENPTFALDRDIELLQWLDHLGFDEAWIGEHHSAGWETIASPEVFIANVAERTRHIKLGTGVMSLPYHQPLMATNRMVLLDHLTRGRAMMGVGPGILLSDARMLGDRSNSAAPPARRGTGRDNAATEGSRAGKCRDRLVHPRGRGAAPGSIYEAPLSGCSRKLAVAHRGHACGQVRRQSAVQRHSRNDLSGPCQALAGR